MPNVKRVAVLSIAVLIAQLLLSMYVYPTIFKTDIQQLFSIQPVTGIGGQTFGDQILGYISGYVSLDISIGTILAMFIGAFLLVGAGFYLYEQRAIPLWQGRNQLQRLFAVLLYGHVTLYAVLYLLKQGVPGIATSLLIGLAVNLVAVSAVITLAARYLNWPRV